ncbi:MAG: hypothetical protein LBQ79_05030 [Deltaproteobacteria bacterium]|nr:hypothetical protein [Deltaproteobacteria bacterium]
MERAPTASEALARASGLSAKASASGILGSSWCSLKKRWPEGRRQFLPPPAPRRREIRGRRARFLPGASSGGFLAQDSFERSAGGEAASIRPVPGAGEDWKGGAACSGALGLLAGGGFLVAFGLLAGGGFLVALGLLAGGGHRGARGPHDPGPGRISGRWGRIQLKGRLHGHLEDTRVSARWFESPKIMSRPR